MSIGRAAITAASQASTDVNNTTELLMPPVSSRAGRQRRAQRPEPPRPPGPTPAGGHNRMKTTLWGREPAVILAAIQAAIALALAFGWSLSDEQLGAVMAAAAILLGLITRSQVSPAPAPAQPPAG